MRLRFFSGAFMVVAAYVVIKALPDLKRYLKIRAM